MKELYRVFYDQRTGKELLSYTIRGEAEAEAEETARLLAYENNIAPELIQTRTEERKSTN